MTATTKGRPMTARKPVYPEQNLVSRAQTKVHAPASLDSDYYLCRPPGTKGQYGPPVFWCRTSSPVDCKACLRKLDLIKLLSEPGLVTAYIGTGDPYAPDNKAIILATATLFRQSEGATFSGWVVRNETSGTYSDPIPRRPDALTQLRDIAAELAPLYADSLEG